MNDTEQERESPKFATLPIDWHIPDNVQSRYANNVLVQSAQHEIVISFFEALLPPLVGTPEDNVAKLREIGSIRADLVARIIVAPGILPSIISALQTGLEKYQDAYGSLKASE